MLEGFTILKEKEGKKEECIATISKNNINFTLRTVKNMKNPEYIVLGVNREKRQLGIACVEKSSDAIPFCKDGEARNCYIGAGSWRNEISAMMPDWDLKNYNYKMDGKFNEDHSEIIFDLEEAVPKPKRRRVVKQADGAEEAESKEISTEEEPLEAAREEKLAE